MSLKKAFILLFSTLTISTFAQTITDPEVLNKYYIIPTDTLETNKGGEKSFFSFFEDGRANVLLFFSPSCEHCQDEISHIQTEINNFQDVNFLLITNRPHELVDTFITNRFLDTVDNFHVIFDKTNAITRYYGISGYPSMVIYDYSNIPVVKYLMSMVPPRMIWNQLHPNNK